jgi:hypothetical protein
MSNECYDYSVIPGCYLNGAGARTSVVIHYYTDYAGQPATRITDTAGVIIAGATAANTSPGACMIDVGEYQVELSDLILGCALDAEGQAIGSVVLSKVYNEETGVIAQVRVMYPYGGGTPVSPYVGAFGNCGDAEVTSVIGCYNGDTPVTIHYIHGNPGLEPSVIVTDTFGQLIMAASPADTFVGVCQIVPVETKHLIYLERNGGIVTMGDIVATTGAAKVMSVTVKQIAGRGTIAGDSGSGVPMDAGETWSWSAVSDQNSDYLSASALSMDAGGGEQRITATYYL